MTAPQQPVAPTTTLPFFGPVTRGQIVHVLKLVIAALPGFIAAVVPGISPEITKILYEISGLLGTGEVVAHGIGGGR